MQNVHLGSRGFGKQLNKNKYVQIQYITELQIQKGAGKQAHYKEAGATKEEMNKIVPYTINGGQMWVFKRQLCTSTIHCSLPKN